MGNFKGFITIILFFLPFGILSQEITLFQQFNGRYDYLAYGNTLNPIENGLGGGCTVLSDSSADLLLQPDQQLIGLKQ